MIVYEYYHFGDQQEISLYHIREFSHFAHLHRSYELLRLKNGKLMATVDGREFLMQPGDRSRGTADAFVEFVDRVFP